jgi:hypothetical protein
VGELATEVLVEVDARVLPAVGVTATLAESAGRNLGLASGAEYVLATPGRG